MPLDPASQFLNDLVVGSSGAVKGGFDHVALRAGMAMLDTALPPSEFLCSHRDLDLEGVPAVLMSPPNASSAVMIWFHGGGWVIGSVQQSLGHTDALAAALGCHLLSVDYRLAPEHPFPAAHDDAETSVRWMQVNAEQYGIDAARISVGGDSAGGNLAAAVAQKFGSAIATQLLVYPITNIAGDSDSYATFGEGYLLSAAVMHWFADMYTTPGQRTDPRVSPLLADEATIAATARAHFVVAEFDPLRDEGLAYAERLREMDVSVSLDRHDDQMHGFFAFPQVIPGAVTAMQRAVDALRDHL
jgi:acetyl esterase